MLTVLQTPIVSLYINIVVWILLGFALGKFISKRLSDKLGEFLYWVGIPLAIVAFVPKANISGFLIIAPLTAWVAVLIGAVFAWIWIELGLSDEQLHRLSGGNQWTKTSNLTEFEIDSYEEKETEYTQAAKLPSKSLESFWKKPTQGSFLLAMMVGNTAYLGFPVVLSVVGNDYFSWAVLYNTLGTSVAVHGLGSVIANRFGNKQTKKQNLLVVLLKNPALWSFVIGVVLTQVSLGKPFLQILSFGAQAVVFLSLLMIGIQLSRLKSFTKLRQSAICLFIKMVLVPLVVGSSLIFFGITNEARLTLVLLMGMPPSFATVLYSEAYALDQELTTTTVVLGIVFLLLTLPMWLFLFT